MIPIMFLSFAFGLSELILMFVKRSKTASSKTRADSGSLIILWITITLGFIMGFFLSKPAEDFFAGFGLVLIIYGLIIRWVAILQLGRSFTVDVVITEVTSLKMDGIYGRIRHPSYSGLLAIVTGFGVTMSSLYSFIIFVVPVFLAVLYRIGVEEKVLIKESDNRYLEYISRTKKLIPGIY
jgi:protein-S-isoprenylcysteine O-methyltransferase Ste14